MFPGYISNSTFCNSAEYGVNLRASSSDISNSQFYDNAGFGVFADLSLNFSITESEIIRNTVGGIRIPINSQAVINESLVDTNGVGILVENNGRPKITNSTIRANNIGIQLQEVGSSQPLVRDNTISGNTISGNSSHGIWVHHGMTNPEVVFRNNSFLNNGQSGLLVNSARMTGITTDEALEVSGNTISSHTSGTGLISTRAFIEDNTFENNIVPIAVMDEISLDETTNSDGNFYDGNTFTDNTYADAIGIFSTSNLSLNGNLGYSWPASFSNPAYFPISGDIYINSGDSVNVAPGTVVKLGRSSDNESFRIEGSLIAEGESDSKIIFTSLLDDTYAGDTNRDSTDTVPSRGNWDEIYINGSSSSQTMFKNVIPRYADTNYFFDNNTQAVIDSSFVSNARYGIYSEDRAKPTIHNTDIHTNQYGIRVQNDSDGPILQLINFYDNDDAALYTFRDVTAINNYWGDSTGPLVEDESNTDPNLSGQGDEILVSGSNRVEYEPWQVSRSGVLLGDVSEGGTVTAFDGSLILQFIVGDIDLNDNQKTASDVTGDGSITAFDASNVLQFVVGAISGFPGA